MALKATSSASFRRLIWIAANSSGGCGMRRAENVPDDRAHALLADPDARRDLGDRNAAVEIIDDQLFPLELRQPRGARFGRRGAGGGWRSGFETIGQAALSF